MQSYFITIYVSLSDHQHCSAAFHVSNRKLTGLIVINFATFSTVKWFILFEYVIFILEKPIFVSAELIAIVLIIALAFCIL